MKIHRVNLFSKPVVKNVLGSANHKVQRAASAGLLMTVGFATVAWTDHFAQAAIDAYSTAVNADSPYAYYRFGESSGPTLTDFSGNARNGAYTNVPTLGQTGYAPAGQTGDTAASFNGTSNYGTLSNNTSFGSMLSNFSIEIVFKTKTTASTTIFGATNSGNGVALQIGLNQNQNGTSADNQTRLFLRCSSTSYYFGAAFTNSAIYDGNYHDVVFSFSQATATLNVYVDGVAQTITKNSANIDKGTFGAFDVNPMVGAVNNRGSAGSYAAATIDELALYSTTLTGTDAAEHYAALTAVPEPASLGVLGLMAGVMILRRR